MKQILQSFKTGNLEVHEVPTPLLQPNGVLVRTHYSIISAGTEGGTVRLAKKNLLDKALSRPDLVKKVLNIARTDGWLTAYQAVNNNLDAPLPLGYSLAGEVIEVGENITDLHIGDKVACYGSMIANHAEINYIPYNLCVKIPSEVELSHASFCMIAAIALQGVRRAEIEIGSTVLVIGLGLIGQITVQLLRVSGCRVFGIDIDPSKLPLAQQSGAEQAMLRSESSLEEAIAAFSNGLGVDATIITAATPTADPIELAGRVTRPRGRVVAVGRVPYELPREEYLFKEIDFITTLAFGPGVNDPNYELKGMDYPAAFVRWTGHRNIEAILSLMAQKQLDMGCLISHTFAIEQAEQAFALLTGKNPEPSIGILLRYAIEKPYSKDKINFSTAPAITAKSQPGVSIIGAGSHAVSFLFKAIEKLPITKQGIVSAGGFKAKWYGEKYGFQYTASETDALFKDENTEAVLILSRHDSHGPLTIEALQHKKHVFVEKPLCLKPEELEKIIQLQAETGCCVMVGYNRRYAELGLKMKEVFKKHAQPINLTYRMNAGFRPANHWLHDSQIGGGLILGEAVHFIDFAQYIIDSPPISVYAQSIHSSSADIINADNVTISIRYQDGSISTINYASTGDKSFGRERIEIFTDNAIAILEDWRFLTFSKNGKRKTYNYKIRQDKGFDKEMQSFVEAITQGNALQSEFQETIYGMQIAFAALESLRTGQVIQII